MVFLRDEETAARWKEDGANGRDIFSLAEAVWFAAEFFLPLLGPPALKEISDGQET